MNESHKILYSKFNEVSDNYKETKKEEDKKLLASIHEDLDKQVVVPVDKAIHPSPCIIQATKAIRWPLRAVF